MKILKSVWFWTITIMIIPSFIWTIAALLPDTIFHDLIQDVFKIITLIIASILSLVIFIVLLES